MSRYTEKSQGIFKTTKISKFTRIDWAMQTKYTESIMLANVEEGIK